MATVARRAHTAKTRSAQLRRTALRALVIAGVVGLSLLVSACGDSSGGAKVAQGTNNNANGSQSSSASGNSFSACMRSHGLPNFPDPGSDGRINWAGIDKASQTFQAAYRSCRALDLGGVVNRQTRAQLEQQLRQLLPFAACMRAHGVPTFADPEISPNGHSIAFAVIDTHSPAFARAAAACRGTLSGDQSSKLGKILGGGKQPAGHGGK
jgi:hypothetical protein